MYYTSLICYVYILINVFVKLTIMDIEDINIKAAIAFALVLIAGLLTYLAFFK